MLTTEQVIGQILKQKYPVYQSQKDDILGKAYLAKYNPESKPVNLPNQFNNQPSTQLNPVTNLLSNLSGLVGKYFPTDQIQNALKIIQAESGGNTNAIGDNYPIDTGNGPETIPSYGLFQIRGLPGRPDKQTLLNPEQNIAYASQLYKQQGWNPWSTAKGLGLL